MLSDFTNVLHLGLLFITLFTGGLFYFKIATHLGFVTKPDDVGARPVVRGGGLIFVLAMYSWFALYRLSFPWFVIGVTVIALAGYAKDLNRMPRLVLVAAQAAAFTMILHHTGMLYVSWWLTAALVVAGIAALNGFNFMNGIAGMIGAYGLANLVSFYYINTHIVHFSYSSMIVFMIVAVVVFLFFNFRHHPVCDAGHVGSATLAFVQLFLMLQLIAATGNFFWVFFFVVYALDVTVTMVHRFIRRENVFTTHRKHFYQVLVYERGMSPLMVALLYGLVQLAINIILIVVLGRMPA